MHFDEAIDQFIRHTRIERGLSENTVKAYQADLVHLWRYLTENGREALPLADLTPLFLKDFVAHLRDDLQYKPRSIGRIMSSMRVFFDYARQRGWLAASPAEALKNPKIPRKLPVFMLDDEVSRLLKVPDKADLIGYRNYAILLTFLLSGMRLSELVGLNSGDIDFEGGTVLVRGKGSKERLLPLHRKVREVLWTYLDGFRPSGKSGDTALFLTEEGERMTARMVGYVVEKSVREAGVSHGITPHKLRHTFATQLLHKGTTLLEIKELLGHSQLATTSIYTHTNVQRLRRAVDKIDD